MNSTLVTLLNSFRAVGVILILTACGYVFTALGWIKPDAKRFLTKYLMLFAVPVMCIYSLRTNLTLELIRSSWTQLLIPAVTSFVLYALAIFIGRRMHLDPKQSSVFAVMCAVSNAMFIGYPMCTELFGEACVPYVMTFFLINTAYSQLVGVAGICRAGGQRGNSPWEAVLNFFKTPSILGVFIGVLLILVDWTPPPLVMSCARYVNNTVTPLALLTVGNIIYGIGLKNLRLNKLLNLMLVFRFLLAPGIALLMCALLGVTGMARGVLVVQSAMPVLTQTVVAASEYGADEELAAQGVTISLLACFIVIPVLMLLL